MRVSTASALALCAGLIVLSHAGLLFEPAAPAKPTWNADAGVILIVDVSGSMEGSKILRAREAVRSVIESLPPDTTVGVRSFSTMSNLVQAPVTARSVNVERVAYALVADGGTRCHEALEAIPSDLARVPGTPHWRLVLVSDGEGNDPSRDLAAAQALATRYPTLTCDTIGIQVSQRGASELDRIATVLRGKSWNVNQEQLAATMRESLSLVGDGGRGGAAAEGRWRIALLALLLGAILGLGAARSRETMSEPVFTAMLAATAGAGALVATHLALPSAGSSLSWVTLVQNMAFFSIVGGLFGVTLAVAEGFYMGNPRRALEQASLATPVGIFGGVAAGLVGQALFSAFGGALGGELTRHIVRAIGWAVAGALIGACPGVAARSQVRIKQGALGGLAGGFAGGWMFEWLAVSSGYGARLAALVSMGVAIGAMVRMVEQARKQAWLVLICGGPEGKEFILTNEETSLGSHYQDDVCVAGDRGHPQREAVIVQEKGKKPILRVVAGGRAKVDDVPALGDVVLVSGSVITIGEARLIFQLRDAGQTDPYVLERARSAAQNKRHDAQKPVFTRVPEQPEGIEFCEDGDDAEVEEDGIELGDVKPGAGRPPARKVN